MALALPRSALQLVRDLPETRAYFEADDALYNFESEFFRYAASGFPLRFADPYYRREFDAKRARLERDWSRAWRAAQLATAQAIEARRAETGTGSVHESAVGNADAPGKGQP